MFYTLLTDHFQSVKETNNEVSWWHTAYRVEISCTLPEKEALPWRYPVTHKLRTVWCWMVKKKKVWKNTRAGKVTGPKQIRLAQTSVRSMPSSWLEWILFADLCCDELPFLNHWSSLKYMVLSFGPQPSHLLVWTLKKNFSYSVVLFFFNYLETHPYGSKQYSDLWNLPLVWPCLQEQYWRK